MERTLVFDTALGPNNIDTIYDFGLNNVRDLIHLDNSIFKNLSTGKINADNFVSNASGEAQDNNDFIVHNQTTGMLSYDADGNGSGKKVDFAKVLNNGSIVNLTHDDIIVI